MKSLSEKENEIQLPKNVKFYFCPVFWDIKNFIVRFMSGDYVNPT